MRKITLSVLAIMLFLLLPFSVKAEYDYPVHSDIPMEDDWQTYAQFICEYEDVSYPLVLAICYYESKFNASVKNSHGCVGLMQIKVKYFQSYMEQEGITEEMMTNPYANVTVGILFLKDLFEKYEEPIQVLQAYHGEKITGTSKYANMILNKADEYTQLLYGR